MLFFFFDIKGSFSILKLKFFQELGGLEGSGEGQVCEFIGLELFGFLFFFVLQCIDYLEWKNIFNMLIFILYFVRFMDYLVLMLI